MVTCLDAHENSLGAWQTIKASCYGLSLSRGCIQKTIMLPYNFRTDVRLILSLSLTLTHSLSLIPTHVGTFLMLMSEMEYE
jgi:hypothetical protein